MDGTSGRPAAKRLPSGGWGRLRAPQIDPLAVYGLPSKGETRLNDTKAQEAYYRKIVDRYMKFCATSGSGDKLEAAFKSMYMTEPLDLRKSSSTVTSNTPSQSTTSLPFDTSQRPQSMPLPPHHPTPAQQSELSLLLTAMRKLRESLTATSRTDLFAQRAYLFILRSTLLMRQWEAYVPCITALLSRIHPVTPLANAELRDVVGWLVLDAACRRADVAEAIRVRAAWRGKTRGPSEVNCVLQALVRDDWLAWRRVGERVDGYGRALMGFAEERMRVHTLKVVGRAYLKIEREALEAWTGKTWEELVTEGVGWELEGDEGRWVTVRKIKGKTS